MFFVTMLRFKFHFYKYLPDDKTRIKYPHSGVLWAVNAKSLHHMIPFTDETLKRLQVVPSFELGEGFKVLTVSPDNVIWTSKHCNKLFALYARYQVQANRYMSYCKLISPNRT